MNSKPTSFRVLIVEDELIQSLYLEKILTSLGFRVVDSTTSGKEAIIKALQLKPDFITMDINLADEVDGIDATHEIQKKLQIPVLYITGNSDYFLSEKLLKTLYIGLLAKPVSRENIHSSIKSFCPQTDIKQLA